MKPRTFAIIQARMASTRLPGKVLLDIAGQPMLARVVERTRRAKRVDEVVVATTVDPADDPVAALCEERGYLYYRGSMNDVLDRFYQAACRYDAQVIVRITADCPLMDPGVIDETVDAFFGLTDEASTIAAPYDFAANRLPPPWHRTYPIGLDVEVCSFQALRRTWKEADLPYQREHVMPYLYEKEGRFRVALINHDPDYGSLRWTVDTPEDLELVRQIYARLGDEGNFTWLDILDLFKREPQLGLLNVQVHHKHLREA